MKWLAVCLVSLGAAPAAAQSPIDFARLVPSRDSFVVLIQGQPRGFEVIVLDTIAGGFIVRDVTSLLPVMRQETEVSIGKRGAMLSVKQRGVVQGKEMAIDVTYADGKARGMAMTPGPDGQVRHVTVDSPVPADAVDDNVVLPLLVGLDWKPGARFTLPVFASGQNKLQATVFEVVGTERITVPAGTFDTYKVTVTGVQNPMTIYLSAAAPHRVLRAVPEGSPLEVVAAR